jgi:hypothetical protein
MSSKTGTDFSRIPQSQPAATLSNVSRGGVFWRIEQGGAFIAVGALHLAGPTGIVQQLPERGYRLSLVE